MFIELSLKHSYSTICGKNFQIYGVQTPRKCIDLRHFYSCPYPLKTQLQVLVITPYGEGIYSFSKAAFFWKSVSPNRRKGWMKLWFTVLKFSQKIRRWFGAISFLYCVCLAIFWNVMALQFCKWNLSYSMVLILLLLLCNYDDLILKLNQKKSYIDEGWLFIGSFKVGSVPGMINRDVFVQFIYKPA